MIILSVGMQKAGTGWYFNLTNDLLVAAGYQDVRNVRRKYHLQSVLKYQNCNLEQLTSRNLWLIAIPHLFGNTFVVKTHQGPSPSLQYFIAAGIIKVTYICRDPRDAAVSAFEHGEAIRRKGETHTFASLGSIADAILFMERQLTIWEKWLRRGAALPVRYEDLVADPLRELSRLADFLSIHVPTEILERVAAAYHPDRVSTDVEKSDILHFNKGMVGRFRDVMKLEELELCKRHFGDYLQKMGYPE